MNLQRLLGQQVIVQLEGEKERPFQEDWRLIIIDIELHSLLSQWQHNCVVSLSPWQVVNLLVL